jgi:hypothetical protein
LLPLLVLSVFVDPDSKACELIGDPKTSVVSIRYNRSFSDVAKIANFSSNKGSDWVCARACWISNIAYSNREALFFAKYVLTFSNIYIPLFICLTKSVRVINLSNCFNRNVCFRFLAISNITCLFSWLVDEKWTFL